MKNLLKLDNEAAQLTNEYLAAAINLCGQHKLDLNTDNISMVLHWLGYFQQAIIQMSVIDNGFDGLLQDGDPPAKSDGDAEVTLEN